MVAVRPAGRISIITDSVAVTEAPTYDAISSLVILERVSANSREASAYSTSVSRDIDRGTILDALESSISTARIESSRRARTSADDYSATI